MLLITLICRSDLEVDACWQCATAKDPLLSARSAEQLLAHWDQFGAEFQAESVIDTFRRLAALRENAAKHLRDARMQRLQARIEGVLQDHVSPQGLSDIAWARGRLAARTGALVGSACRACPVWELEPQGFVSTL